MGPRPGARIARSGASACPGGLLALCAGAEPSRAAQDAGERPAVLLVLDASRSMNAPSGDGGPIAARRRQGRGGGGARHRAGGGAARPAGLRRARRRAGRAKACADTELVAPVEAGDRAAMRAAGAGARGQGPHADRPLAAGDAGRLRRRRPHPPGHPRLRRARQLRAASPCAAARRVAGRARADDLGRRASRSTTRAAPDALHRARRRRDVRRRERHRPAAGGAARRVRPELPRLRAARHAGRRRARSGRCAAAGEGLYHDELRSGDVRDYTVSGRARTAALRVGHVDPRPRDRRQRDAARRPARPRRAGGQGRVRRRRRGRDGTVRADRHDQPARAAGRGARDPERRSAGYYDVHLRFEEGSLDPRPLPIEIWVQALDPGEAPGKESAPGPPPEPARTATPTPSPTPAATPRAEPAADGDGGVLVAAGVGGLLAGLLGGLFTARGRRR